MKFVKRITVFFIIPMTMFACGFASSTAIMEFFYPGKNVAEKRIVYIDDMISGNDIMEPEPEPEMESEEKAPKAVEVSIKNETSINADTTYIIQEYNRNDGELREENIPVPETFVGMNRDLFTKTMNELNDFPTLSELEKGFVGCEVISFSPQKVVVRKTYELEEMPEGFYLVNENNFVTVYYADMQTVYMNTNITLKNLPEELQQEILYIKFIEQEEELYDFLEAYSS